MRTVWKFPLNLHVYGPQTVHLPSGYRFIAVGEQEGNVVLWAEVDPAEEPSAAEVEVVGTGGNIPPDSTYIGTAQVGPFVWHVYAR